MLPCGGHSFPDLFRGVAADGHIRHPAATSSDRLLLRHYEANMSGVV
jgi:hypothetical protein